MSEVDFKSQHSQDKQFTVGDSLTESPEGFTNLKQWLRTMQHSEKITISCVYLFLTSNSRSVFCAGVSLNIHSFIHSEKGCQLNNGGKMSSSGKVLT